MLSFFALRVPHCGLIKQILLSLQTKSTPETSHRQDIQLWIGGMHKVLYHTQRPEEAHSHTHRGEAIPVRIQLSCHIKSFSLAVFSTVGACLWLDIRFPSHLLYKYIVNCVCAMSQGCLLHIKSIKFLFVCFQVWPWWLWKSFCCKSSSKNTCTDSHRYTLVVCFM